MGQARLKELVAAGVDTIPALVNCPRETWVAIFGSGSIVSTILESIREHLSKVTLPHLLNASCCWNQIGSKRFETILEYIPDLLQRYQHRDRDALKHDLEQVPGIKSLSEEVLAG